ncbi:TIGR02281 family clan AA aspartic protease [Rhizobium sp. 18065]|uniref:TIGR02281 family clan AA aspartic protease n=1 Tax=Rhizobium sp. 18065 TaxID=2681411 RepID=UPI00135C8489|nr:TIGR02281 family clan AA aspartic protease [Rhizobium sp. 18065]
MFVRTLITVSFIAMAASQVPTVWQALQAKRMPQQDVASPPVTPASTAPPGQTVLKAGPGGHYAGSFRMNGKQVDGMIDTGASLVAINETTARRLGFSAAALDFKYPISTANGTTQAAHVVIDRIEIGSVRVRGIDAFVLKDKQLSSSLIGMSFLKKLKSYSAGDGTLRLVQ